MGENITIDSVGYKKYQANCSGFTRAVLADKAHDLASREKKLFNKKSL